jgi:formate C-acetyltransferase
MTASLTLDERLAALRATKLRHTKEKQELQGAMDFDDWAIILPPPDRRKVVETVSGSGVKMTDVSLQGVDIRPNDPNGGFFGPKACGENFKALLDAHPAYVDPMSALAGAYMANFFGYRKAGAPSTLDMTAIDELSKTYALYHSGAPIFGSQHFCQDLKIGLDLGFGGLLAKVRRCRDANAAHAADFYAGLEAVLIGLQGWVKRTADAAAAMARDARETGLLPLVDGSEIDAPNHMIANLDRMAAMNAKLVEAPPETFLEACQWIGWYQMMARMYNGSGSLGRMDALLQPYYDRDIAAGRLTDDEAVFYVACYYLMETGYIQIGGPDEDGIDVTTRLSYLILEAARRLDVPVNLGVAVGRGVPEELARKAVEVQIENRSGVPKFLAVDNTAAGFARNGYPIELGYARAYSGCHWLSVPGREYSMNDMCKVNFAAVFEVALKEMMSADEREPSTSLLWELFKKHLRRSVEAIAAGFDFHFDHMSDVFPELPLDLCCYGPVEKGLDASGGGVELYNFCVDGSALATTADSFAALEQRVECERRLTWRDLMAHLAADYAGPQGERVRHMMRSVPRFGSGGSPADEWAARVSEAFTGIVTSVRTPKHRHPLLPGLFSWAAQIAMGQGIGATPNGRHADAPISHGCNPDPGFRKDGAPTALAVAVAAVQSGRGNTAPMQLDMDPMIARDEDGVETVLSLIRTHFDLGGTQINMNVMNRERVLEAHADPSKHPDLVVRVTGFSAYFASLSPAYRQQIVDRMLAEA